MLRKISQKRLSSPFLGISLLLFPPRNPLLKLDAFIQPWIIVVKSAWLQYRIRRQSQQGQLLAGSNRRIQRGQHERVGDRRPLRCLRVLLQQALLPRVGGGLGLLAEQETGRVLQDAKASWRHVRTLTVYEESVREFMGRKQDGECF